MFRARKNLKGFTLAEIAVVMTIAGVAAGGAVVGHNMIRTADVAATVMQVKAVETSIMKFHDYFQALPGDMADADTRIKNCNAACKNTAPDAGDGKIGSPTWNMAAFQSGSIANAANTTDAGETVTFWWELANADLGFTGITAAGVTGGTATFGGSLPASHMGGGLMVGFSDGTQAGAAQGRPAAAGPYSITGTVLALAAVPTALSSAPGVQVLKPSEAAQLDRKIDDGLPNTGNVQAYGVSATCYGAAAPFGYLEKSSAKDCGLYFRVGNPPVNGRCGGANTVASITAPVAGLCSAGGATVVGGGVASPWSWACNGSGGGTNAICGAPVSGACGTANGVGTITAPIANLCAGGALDAVAGSGPWTWNCNGTAGGVNAACAAPVNGTCGTDNGQTLAAAPANLCSSGAASAVSGAGPWNWNCNGSAGGASANCAASKMPVNGVCGADNGQTLASAPVNLCSVGASSGVSGSGPWNWSCLGQSGGANVGCSASKAAVPVNGVAGPANGTYTDPCPNHGGPYGGYKPDPDAGWVPYSGPGNGLPLCTSGTLMNLDSGSGNGWSWSCVGLNGGTTAQGFSPYADVGGDGQSSCGAGGGGDG